MARYANDVIAVAKARGLNVMTVGSAGETLRRVSLANDGFAQRHASRSRGHHLRRAAAAGRRLSSRERFDGRGTRDCRGRRHRPRARQRSRTLRGVPGRLEIVGEANGGLAIVDYAHKPEALIAALAACRPFVSGKLICVFGCGGDRDKGKRPIMGEIASQSCRRRDRD